MRHVRLLTVVAVGLTIAGLVAAPVALAQVAETGVITVWVFDDQGTPADTSDDVPTSSRVTIRPDDGDGSPDGGAVIAEGQSTPENPLVAEGLDAGSYWIIIDSPGHAPEEPLVVELNTDAALDCHFGDASTPGCVAGDGNTIVSIGLGPPEGVSRITLAVLDPSGDDISAGTFEVRRDDGDGRLDLATDESVFGPLEIIEDDGFRTDPLEPGSYWVVEVIPPDHFPSHDPVLVELNLDPTKTCVWGDLEFWGDNPRCEEGQGYTQVFFIYYFAPSPTQRPAVTAPPTDALGASVAERKGTAVPWLALTGLALTSIGVPLLNRPRRSGKGLDGS